MSDPVPSRMDTVVPDQQAPDTEKAASGLARAPESDLANAETIERMAERLRFYESFDELIQQNISRSGQLMREAGEKRDEAIATIAQSRQQIETERETQRAALTELLDDVMTIQQATERLAHRVSDALEQIEFELEPIGLHDIGALASRQSGRLPAGFSDGSDSFQSVAESVDDEYRHGVLGQPRLGTSPMPSASVPRGVEPTGSNYAEGKATPDAFDSANGLGGDPNGRGGNPENSELGTNEPDLLDAAALDDHAANGFSEHEPLPGAGEEAAPVGASSAFGDLNADVIDVDISDLKGSDSGSDSDDLMSVVEPYAEANVAPYAERSEPDGDVLTPGAQVTSDVTDENLNSGERSEDEIAAIEIASADDLGAETSLSVDGVPVLATSTGSNVPSVEEPTTPEDGMSRPTTGGLSGGGIDAEVSAVSSDPTPASFDSSPETVGTNNVSDSEVIETNNVVPVVGSPAVTAAVELTEQQTTVVLDGVPRAAIALAIQRHILSKPDVLRAEVREYYDHRLTLFVTSRRATTAEDLQDWDGAATWEQIRTSPELLELRMVM